MGYSLSQAYCKKRYRERNGQKPYVPKHIPSANYVMDMLKVIGHRRRDIE